MQSIPRLKNMCLLQTEQIHFCPILQKGIDLHSMNYWTMPRLNSNNCEYCFQILKGERKDTWEVHLLHKFPIHYSFWADTHFVDRKLEHGSSSNTSSISRNAEAKGTQFIQSMWMDLNSVWDFIGGILCFEFIPLTQKWLTIDLNSELDVKYEKSACEHYWKILCNHY